MLAADTNLWISLFLNEDKPDTNVLRQGLMEFQIFMPPVVLSELCSDPDFPKNKADILSSITMMDVDKDFWIRAGFSRAKLIQNGYKPKLPDTLIAQNCIDYKIPLLTRDKGFIPFAEQCGLKLLKV